MLTLETNVGYTHCIQFEPTSVGSIPVRQRSRITHMSGQWRQHKGA